ncbi:hypothetical protein FNH22_11150 [Fulvivirga sp. M361]|uniref:hypothetical protein n=1 Tax=Fulvivirga sp. M361 TaxID=2594266 RepID=UPI001179E0D4|nr:hypothetical protein [Fulvivirga sp. M361]TRX59077.1 hypothetical protein FNH22_11150 [Fulvivirga sp. M361]
MSRIFASVRVLKNCIIGLLIINTLLSALTVPLIYLDFNVRRDYIAKALCINRDQPITMCGGKCYLDTNLGKVSENQDKKSAGTQRGVEISFFSQELMSLISSLLPVEREKEYMSYDSAFSPSSFYEDIFHPPKSF